MPVVFAWDNADAFPNAWRSSMFRNVADYFPDLLSYSVQCYGGDGTIYALSDGMIVREWTCSNGVWQGDPLGVHHMCLSILGFLQALLDKCKPWLLLEDPEFFSAVTVGIVDDLTQVLPRCYAPGFAKWFLAEAPKHGIVLNIDKWQVFYILCTRMNTPCTIVPLLMS